MLFKTMAIQNFGLIAKASVPLDHRGLVFVVGDNQDSTAADSNGSGKSTLFKALTWCLYGETVGGSKGNDVVRHGELMAMVSIDVVDDDGAAWKITRDRVRGNPSLRLYDGAGKAWSGPKDQSQAKINDIVGLDFKAFKNTVLYGQNDTARFADPRLPDGARKEMLHRILNTEALKDAHKWALDKAREIKAKVDANQRNIDIYNGKLEVLDVAAIEKKCAQWEQERDEQVASLADFAQKRLAASKVVTDVEKIQALVGQLKEKLVVVDVRQCRADATAAQTKYSAAERKLALVDADVVHAKELLASLDGETCPICETPFTVEPPAKVEGAARLKLLEAERAKLAKQVASEREAAKAASGHLAAAEEQERATGQARVQLAKAEAALLAAGTEAKRREEARQEAKGAIDRIKALKAQPNPHTGDLEKAAKQREALEEGAKKLLAANEEAEQEAAHVQFWVRGFSPSGLPSYMLDNVMPVLTERANSYLATLADGDITVNFSTQRELKSAKGEMRDEINISWVIEGVPDKEPSGGQQRKLEVATDLALMDLVGMREKGRADLLVLDEVLDGLDKEGRARVLQLLQELRARRGSIFVISHETDVSEVFERVVTVTKKGGVATVEER